MKKISIVSLLLILCMSASVCASGISYPAMQYVVGAGILNGKTTSTLNPKEDTTRAEIAVILERFIEKAKKI